MQTKRIVFLILLMLCFVPSTLAYLDPGSGSFIIQMIIASVAGVAYALKMYWAKVTALFKGRTVEIDPDDELND